VEKLDGGHQINGIGELGIEERKRTCASILSVTHIAIATRGDFNISFFVVNIKPHISDPERKWNSW